MGQVSVVIPWGKSEGDIDRAISSALLQTSAPVEVLVVANGSLSERDVILKKEKFSSQVVNVINLLGCSNANIARNHGSALARSDFIAYLDSDDWWDPNHLEISISDVEKENADFVYSGMRILGADGNVTELFASDYRLYGGMENYLLSYEPAPTSSLVVKRKAVLENPWNSGLRRHQDYDFTARMARKYSGACSRQVTVNVDWSNPTRHHAYADCFRVLKEFSDFTEDRLFDRHCWNLFKSSFRSNDPVWIKELHVILPVLKRKAAGKVFKKFS